MRTFPVAMVLSLAASPFALAQTAPVNALAYPGAAWSPYVVGALIGVLSWLTFYFSDKPIGASSFYATLAGMVGKIIAPRHTASLKYYRENPPKFDWAIAFVGCAIIGAFIAAYTGGEITNEWRYTRCGWRGSAMVSDCDSVSDFSAEC